MRLSVPSGEPCRLSGVDGIVNQQQADGRQEKGVLQMSRIVFRAHRIAVLVAALVIASAIVAFTSAASVADTGGGNSADPGRTITGVFCGSRCISLSFDGQTSTSTARTDFTLRPGVYWFSLIDNFTFHNFDLRSCPSDAVGPCSATSSGASEQDLTTDGFSSPDPVFVKVNLGAGVYRVFCDVDGHESVGGMYVDFRVGGVGQLG